MWSSMKKLIVSIDSEVELNSVKSSANAIEEEPSTTLTSEIKRRRFPRKRTPMGSYIVPEGEKALTSLGDASPGPADYKPKVDLIKQVAPQYSLVGKPKNPSDKRDIPGPFNYNTSGDIIWKRKKISLKGREKCSFDKDAEKSASLLGKYKVENLGVGTSGPKFSIGTRPGSRIQYGPANSLVQPVDTKGFQTPGPNYRPNSSYWGRGPKKSLGDRWKSKEVQGGPGPADYEVQTTHRGPSHSFGIKLPESVSVQGLNKTSPAANTYDIGTTIGKAPAISFSGRYKDTTTNTQVPCPTSYTPEYKSYNKMYKAVTLTYRWFDSDEDSKNPGPADYNVKYVNLKNYPRYTCRQRVKTSYPESVLYYKGAEDTPGPGAYSPTREFTKNERPAYSFGKRLETRSAKENIPGPNAYAPEKYEKPSSKKTPSFSMGKRLVSFHNKNDNPGPGEYSLNPKLYESEKGKFTMTPRPKRKEEYLSPVGPNVYTLPELLTGKNKGIVFKSRASPFVYSGFRTNKLEDPRPLPPIVK